MNRTGKPARSLFGRERYATSNDNDTLLLFPSPRQQDDMEIDFTDLLSIISEKERGRGGGRKK